MGKLKSLQEKSSAADRMLKRLKEIVRSSTEKSGIVVDNNLHSDLLNIMQSNDKSIEDAYPAGTFRKEQLKCAMATDARPMRWHPTMIKWCVIVFRRLSLPPIVWISEASI
jgi:ribonuclease D